MKLCENCNVEHDGSFGSGRFCCMKCSRAFSTKNKRVEATAKLRETLAKKSAELTFNCWGCKTAFKRIARERYCSDACKSSARSEHEKIKAQKRIESGTHVGWKVRKLDTPSYPEQYFIDLFNNEAIWFKREVKIGKWFADFQIGNYIVEIDGKQHSWSDRKAKDNEKDAFLHTLGYTVVRIKWFNPRTEDGKRKLYPQIEALKMLICK